MRKFLKRSLTLIALLCLTLFLVLGVNTLTLKSAQVMPSGTALPELRPGHVKRLSEAVRIRTISNIEWSKANQPTFKSFQNWASERFPRVHATLEHEVIGHCSLLFTWKGKDPKARPIALMSHMDVVPVEAHEMPSWTHPPFDGVVANDHIWGRGTLDDKLGVVGILEAAETLLEAGKQPQRDVVFAFGCDEEVGGDYGAGEMARVLRKRNVSFEFVLDEGHIIGKGLFPGVDAPIAFVGLAEKGFVTLELEVTGHGGHSSMPPPHTAMGILAAAIVEIEDEPLEARLNEPARKMFDTLAPEVGMPNRMVFGNLWLFEPVVLRLLTKKPTTNSTVRTTTAATVFHSGIQDNVLPKLARAKVNFRIAPGETIDDVVAHVTEVVDDERVKIIVPSKGFNSNPTKVASDATPAFKTISSSIRGVFGDQTLVTPALTVGGTDSRHFQEVADDVYRFAPLELGPGDPARIHGVDERISVDNYGRVIQFYMMMILDS